jgi:hypothetical protein
MIMRYHWGLAVGHTYASPTAGLSVSSTAVGSSSSNLLDAEDADRGPEEAPAEDVHPIYPPPGMAEDDAWNSGIENPEFSIEDQDDVDLGDGEGSQSDDERDPSDDETFAAMGDMYGFGMSEWDF